MGQDAEYAAHKLRQELAEAKKEFQRMESAWRRELETWYRGERGQRAPAQIESLQAQIAEYDKLFAAVEHYCESDSELVKNMQADLTRIRQMK